MANDKPTPANDKLQAIIEARLRLMQRFHDKMARSPGVADDTPQGSGAPNRHGMPLVPVGQTQTSKCALRPHQS